MSEKYSKSNNGGDHCDELQYERELLNKTNEVVQEKDEITESSLDADIKCGFGFCTWPFLQRCANQSSFIIAFGFVGCIISMTHAYFNGTITTLEKRFHLSSRSIGITQCGNDIVQMITSMFFVYYAGKSHRPRLMGMGVLTLFLYCVLTTLPHWIYGPGEESLKLTLEYSGSFLSNMTANNGTHVENNAALCDLNRPLSCKKEDTKSAASPTVVFFLSHAISGVGYSLYYALGYSYMDDNVEKSKTASMYSISYFLNMLGPSVGYTMAAFCLRQFISPNLHPTINNKDPRWIGAWWLGWLIFGVLLFIAGIVLTLFPKELPLRRKQRLLERAELIAAALKKNKKVLLTDDEETPTKASFSDLLKTFRRLLRNRIFVMNNLSTIFYFFGYMPYWIFIPKYVEIQFRQSAAESNIYTGTVALVFTAVGVLTSGQFVSRRKPRARYMAGWNAGVGFVTALGLLSYSLIGCADNERGVFVESAESSTMPSLHCAQTCHCDFVSYAPVCGQNNLTYISACHAGCKSQKITNSGKMVYTDCDCVPIVSNFSGFVQNYQEVQSKPIVGGQANPGACYVDCYKSFLIFLSVMCFLKFIGATTRANYFLIQLRSVSPDDKAVALAFGMVFMSIFCFIPSPIFFGWLIDRMCLVWGKTCTDKGNCWLYDSHALRYTLNWTAASFVSLGASCDCVVWYLVKNLKIFEDDKKINDENIGSSKELAQLNCTM